MKAGKAERLSVEKLVCLLLSALKKDAVSASATQKPITCIHTSSKYCSEWHFCSMLTL